MNVRTLAAFSAGLWTGVLATIVAMFAFVTCGCDSVTSLVVEGDAEHGTVYVCDSGTMCEGGTEEWCWNGARGDLEALLGAECRAIRITERAWPALVGCAYGCPLAGKGCNAHCGCACEAPL